jgi:hypothetical protein
VSVTCGIYVQFSKCEILMLGKFVSFIGYDSDWGKG